MQAGYRGIHIGNTPQSRYLPNAPLSPTATDHPALIDMNPRTKLASLATVAAIYPVSLFAVALSWDGGGADNNWGTGLNWSTDGAPAAADTLTFADVDETTGDTANNIVAASLSVTSLTYQNTGNTASDFHVTQIDSGQTLTVTNGFTVGGTSATFTNVKITGAGTLTVSGGTYAIRGAAGAQASLDMSGLSTFNATVSSFLVGTANANNQAANRSTLTLAGTNTITATTMHVGTATKGSTFAGQNSVLNLGANNTINANTISLGGIASRQGGTIRFADASGSATTGGTVKIRGTSGGTSRADLTIGIGGDGSQAVTSSVDFTGNSVDALLGTLTVGGHNLGTGTLTGNFSMNAGTVDANTVVVAQRSGASAAATAVGNLNVAGGTFQAGAMTIALNSATANSTATGTLNVSGGSVQVGTSGAPAGITLGTATGTVTLTANATINVTGTGTLSVFGNIAEGSNAGTGTITSTLTVNGGTLDLNGHSITVDAFNLQSGTLKNLGGFNGGSAVVKSSVGALVLDGSNTYTGDTTISAGSFTLADNASMTFYIGINGVTNKVGGSGTAVFDGDFIFDLSGAELADGNSWMIVDNASLGESFSSTFTVTGFSQDNNLWTNGSGFSFDESTGLLSYNAIPEPATAALLGGLAAIGLVGTRRRRIK